MNDDKRQGELLRDEALERLERAHREWIDDGVAAVFNLTGRKDDITTDDVWKIVGDPPKEPRAMGAVMKKAQSLGYIRPTMNMKASTRPACHCRPIRIWKALRSEAER